jgi:hypothetical protein
MNEAFLIVDIAGLFDWPERFGDCRLVDPAKRPTVLHASRKVAEAEALRLQLAHPAGQFCVFEATQFTVRIQAPTHVNLRGETLISEPVARLASVHDEAPF